MCTIVQKANMMKLTDKEKAEIHQLDTDRCIELLHECAERLGLVSVGEYCEIMHMNRRTVYDHIDKGKIKCVDFCGSKLIVINDK